MGGGVQNNVPRVGDLHGRDLRDKLSLKYHGLLSITELYELKQCHLEAGTGANVEASNAVRPEARGGTEWCSVGGVFTRYRAAGDAGPPVVLLHGIGRSLEDWSETVDALAVRHRVYALDLVGFGYTDKPKGPYTLAGLARFVEDFLDALREREPVILVGNSLGGAVTQAFAATRPERVRRLVLVSSAGFGREVTLALRLVTVPGLGELLMRPSRRGAEHTVRSLFHDPAFATETRVEQALDLARQPGAARAFLATARALGSPRGVKTAWRADLRRQLEQHKIPTLIVWGENDTILPARHLPEAARLYPHARTHLFRETGHLPQLERAERFNTLVLDFLDSEREAHA